MSQVQQALREAAGPDRQIGLLYVCVSKRVNTRLFMQGEFEGSFKNPVPGVAVSTVITEKDRQEFYLVSTQGRQGMVKPTRYTVIHDSILGGEDPVAIELLSYKLCHAYFNVAGAISVPAPVQYAHKLAALVGERGSEEKDPP